MNNQLLSSTVKISDCLNFRRLPARLNVEQTAWLLGLQTHDIPLLVKANLLKPLGGGPKNCVKYFAACEIEGFRGDRNWLDRATRAISRRNKSKKSEVSQS